MAPPSTPQEPQTFLGLATYMGPFIPSLSSLTAQLRELVKKGNTFEWITITSSCLRDNQEQNQ